MKTFAIAILLASGTLAMAQTDNTVYARQFPGGNVGLKVTNAMATCTTNTSIPCLIVIDPSMSVWAPGTLPSLCSHCYLFDFRHPGSMGGGVPSGPAFSIQFANSGVTAFASDGAITINPSTHTLNVGAPSGGFTVKVGPLGTMPATWNLDTTTPQTAINSLTGAGTHAYIWTSNGAGGSWQPPAAATGFSSGSNSNGYWEMLPDGFIMQGQSNVTIGGGSTIFTFPVPFTVLGSIQTSVTLNQTSGEIPSTFTACIADNIEVTLTQLTIFTNPDSEINCNWSAWGR